MSHGTISVSELTAALGLSAVEIKAERLLVAVIATLNGRVLQLWRAVGQEGGTGGALMLQRDISEVAVALNSLRARASSTMWWIRRLHSALCITLPRLQCRVLAYIEREVRLQARSLLVPLLRPPGTLMRPPPEGKLASALLKLLEGVKVHFSGKDSVAVFELTSAFATGAVVNAMLDVALARGDGISEAGAMSLYADCLQLRRWLVGCRQSRQSSLPGGELLWLRVLYRPWLRAEAAIRLLQCAEPRRLLSAAADSSGVLTTAERDQWLRLSGKGKPLFASWTVGRGLRCCGVIDKHAFSVAVDVELAVDL